MRRPFSNPSRPHPPLFTSFLRPAVALLLGVLLPSQAFAVPISKSTPNQKSPSQLSSDQRNLHVLSRFTFGPTPEDLANIRKLGVDNWFELQLHPDRLPTTLSDQKLSAHLANFPALQLPVDQLLERFPSNAETRQAANGKLGIPSDPTLAAIYRRHIALYEQKQQDKKENPQNPNQQEKAAKPVAESMQANPPMAQHNNSEKEADKPLVTAILNLPPDQRLTHIFALSIDQYQTLRDSLKGPQKLALTAGMTPAQRELLSDYDNPTRTVVEELQSQRLLRDIYSSHQLQEVMTTFWLNHFNIYLHKNAETPYYLTSFERDVIRPHALGNFEDLLVATAKSPAMLLYLDNSTSTGPDSTASESQKQRIAKNNNPNAKKNTPAGLNENYARELMELHTLGVNGGYTQKDVTEVAKVLTGWTVEQPAHGGNFLFDPTRHEPGDKTVLGHKIKEDGQQEGLTLLHTLASSPKTAHFLSQELAIAFVSDNPPSALVNRMAQTFLSTQGDIPSILRTMLHSPEFWSPPTYQAKVKTPLEFAVSAARASNADITDLKPIINQLNQMGMPLYTCVPPTGYSDKADAWVSTGALVTRMNFGLSLATSRYPGIQTKWTNSTLSTVSNIDLSEKLIETKLVPTGLSEKTRFAVLNQAQTSTNSPQTENISLTSKPPTQSTPTSEIEKQNAQLAGLILGSPEFQRR